MNPRELPTDRLATTDAQGNRIYLYPADVRGIWRSRRNILNGFLILLFLILPWIQIKGHQAILLDIPNRKFAVLGLAFWAHDAPLLLFVFGGAAVTLAFVTAIWGRIWCGWACPQTVFVDGVFRKIERWIEGDSFKRKRLDESPWNSEKLLKKSSKWLLFTVLSLVVSHSFLAYFVGTHELARMMSQSPNESPASFLVMAGVTLLLLFDFGWFREQFCTLVCPYGRFQSVLMDQRSQVVMYDTQRGEPRKGTTPPPTSLGDCVNCYRCVQVCPTGIDIRRGVQLECIACTACMDACDDVMVRLKKPKGLIRYGALGSTHQTLDSKKPWFTHPRALVYCGILLALFIGLVINVNTRDLIQMTWIRAVDTPYQSLVNSQGQAVIVNHFKIDLRNQTFEDRRVTFVVTPLQQEKGIEFISSTPSILVKAGQSERMDLFVRFPKSFLTSGHATLVVEGRSESLSPSSTHQPIIHLSQEVRLVGPFL